eukprot:1180197-Prorocentrum_minimum.AAC.5
MGQRIGNLNLHDVLGLVKLPHLLELGSSGGDSRDNRGKTQHVDAGGLRGATTEHQDANGGRDRAEDEGGHGAIGATGLLQGVGDVLLPLGMPVARNEAGWCKKNANSADQKPQGHDGLSQRQLVWKDGYEQRWKSSRAKKLRAFPVWIAWLKLIVFMGRWIVQCPQPKETTIK